jgi:hypothetical protein
MLVDWADTLLDALEGAVVGAMTRAHLHVVQARQHASVHQSPWKALVTELVGGKLTAGKDSETAVERMAATADTPSHLER